MEVGPLWFATSAVSEAAAIVARLLADSPDGINVGAVRDTLGASRKHVVPLLKYFDATGVTRRRGDLRIGGPRLPQGRALTRARRPSSRATIPARGGRPRAVQRHRAASTGAFMTTPKASGSASSQEWFPSTTTPGVPTATQRASKLARGMIWSRLDHRATTGSLRALRSSSSAVRSAFRASWAACHTALGLRRALGRASSRNTGRTRVSWGNGSTSPGRCRPQSHSGRFAIDRTRRPATLHVDPPTELTSTSSLTRSGNRSATVMATPPPNE